MPNYLLDLFTPHTWSQFLKHGSDISGFKLRQRKVAHDRGVPGTIFLCYLVHLSRWCGALEIISKPFIADEPIFFESDDPYVVRFKVNPLITLSTEHALPMTAPDVWDHLSLTDGVEPGSFGWAQSIGFRASLRVIPPNDGDFLLKLLTKQQNTPKPYPLTKEDERKLRQRAVIKTEKGEVEVEVPQREEELDQHLPSTEAQVAEVRASTQVQTTIAKIGALMGLNIWVPASDRTAIRNLLPTDLQLKLLDRLPLNYDGVTLRTIENIDVIWLHRRSMVRAFEVEHTTSIYSGLLRMADLLALQPNMDIALHIVAPDERREKVKTEILRPVFSLLESGPMAKSCSFISYSQVRNLAKVPHLTHTTDTILEEFEEFFDE
ncbi:hypothetical protein [Shumkonia mesophila]|uniref:hypothetical protein n=1 Tax=Shumkonia mesophila TaxID=2838854 RepID=UPI0029343AFA|nr:hypothetical protein [Shumkonia mesophila]